jgi:hypothetical protein
LESSDQPRSARRWFAEWLFQLTTITIGVLIALSFAELDAGTEPTIRSVDLGISFPSLSDAGWLTAERSGALALMEYPEVQRFAQVYILQALFTDTLPPALVAVQRAGAILNATADPFAMPPAAREALRAQVLELRTYLGLAEVLGRQLLDGYAQLQQQRQLR